MKAVGIAPSSVVLTAPDRIRIEVGGVPIEARLALSPTRRPDRSFRQPARRSSPSRSSARAADAPFTIESVDVANGELVLVATLDPVPD